MDKLLHFTVNFIATLISLVLFWISPLLLIPMFAIGLSIGKEYGDSRAPGNHWSWSDICFDMLGVLSISLVYLYVALR